MVIKEGKFYEMTWASNKALLVKVEEKVSGFDMFTEIKANAQKKALVLRVLWSSVPSLKHLIGSRLTLHDYSKTITAGIYVFKEVKTPKTYNTLYGISNKSRS